MSNTDVRRTWGRWAAGGGLVAAGLVAGAVLAGTFSANAAGTAAAPSATATATPGAAPNGSGTERRGHDGGNRDESKSQRPDETLLTGDTATKVKDAALAKYPGATIQRVETDSDGVYEAHLVTADGKRVTVEVGKDFAVTGEESGPR